MNHNESEIILACKAGDSRRFSELYDQYIEKIYRFIYYKTHHKEIAEDITSVTFMKALERLDTFNPAKAQFSTWLYQIARNTVIDHYRSHKPTSAIEDAWDLEDKTDTIRDVDLGMTLESVQKYMKVLKPAQRDIIILRIWQELSYEEIAAIIGSTEAASKMQFSRAIRALRETMPPEAFCALLFTGVIHNIRFWE